MEIQEEARHERRARLQRRNDRNALLTGLFGLLVIFLGGLVMATSTDPSVGRLIAVLGVVALIVGFVFRGRPVR